MKNTKPLITAALFGIAAFGLSACGDEVNTTEQIINSSDNVSKVDSKDDLPACTDIIAGQTAFVVDDKAFYGCNGEDWNQLDGAIANVGDNICTSVPLDEDDGDGYTIICNGDTIGVIRNGEKGTDGKDGEEGKNGEDGKDGKGCTIKESSKLAATIACGSETFTLDLTGYATAEEDEECNAEKDEGCAEEMKDVELGGASQKGPFVSGTDVTAYELLNGRTLKQTGKTFGGKIENKDGTFNIKTVKLSSQFAYLIADGYYRNEVTGKNSSSAIKLRALTNLKGRSKANINLITHLEYDRIVNLVTKEGKSIAEAKKQAEKEIFSAFSINSEKFEGYAEDYNILEPGDGNAALLAISVLLQGNHTEAQLTALLASLSVDLGDDGVWGNLSDRVVIADWAMEQDLAGNLATFRSNIEGWKLSTSKAPDFEKYIRSFWTTELNLPPCSADTNLGVLVSIKNTASSYYAAADTLYNESTDKSKARLICDADSKSWRFASSEEKDTYGVAVGSKAFAIRGKMNSNLTYVYDGKAWRLGTDEDYDSKLGPCTESMIEAVRQISTAKTDSAGWYICVEAENKLDVNGNAIPFAWRKATSFERDSYELPTNMSNGIIKVVAVTDQIKNYYVFENNSWRPATDLEKTSLGSCTSDNDGLVKEYLKWYRCSELSTQKDGFDIPFTWVEASNEQIDTANFPKNVADGYFQQGNLHNKYFVYNKALKTWSQASDFEADTHDKETHMAWGTSFNDGTFKNGTVTGNYYVFDTLDLKWRPEINSLEHDPKLQGCTKKKRTHHEITQDENGQTITSNIMGTIVQNSQGTYYFCADSIWQKASRPRWDTYGKYCDSYDKAPQKGIINNDSLYICAVGDTFRTYTIDEVWARNIVRYYNGEERELYNGIRCDSRDEGNTIIADSIESVWICRNGHYEWNGYASRHYNIDFDGLLRHGLVSLGTQMWVNLNIERQDNIYDQYLSEVKLQCEQREFKEDWSDYWKTSMDECKSENSAVENTEDFCRNKIQEKCESENDIGFDIYKELWTYEEAQTLCGKLNNDTYNNQYPDQPGPTYFRLPTVKDWEILLETVGRIENIPYGIDEYNRVAPYLKSSSTSWKNVGSDDYGFSAKPQGYCYGYTPEDESNGISYICSGMSDEFGKDALFWTQEGKTILISDDSRRVSLGYIAYITRASVRCVADYSIDFPPPYNKNPIEDKWVK